MQAAAIAQAPHRKPLAKAEERGAQWSVDKLQRLSAASAAAAVEALPAWPQRARTSMLEDGTDNVTKMSGRALEDVQGHPKLSKIQQLTLEEPAHLQRSRMSRNLLPESVVPTRHGSMFSLRHQQLRTSPSLNAQSVVLVIFRRSKSLMKVPHHLHHKHQRQRCQENFLRTAAEVLNSVGALCCQKISECSILRAFLLFLDKVNVC